MRKRGGAKCLNSSMRKDGFTLGYENYSDEYFPTNLIEISSMRKNRLHPTQKPIELLEYLIKSYSKEGDVVCDSFLGSGSTAVACIKTKRHFIGYELDNAYFRIAQKRVNDEQQVFEMI